MMNRSKYFELLIVTDLHDEYINDICYGNDDLTLSEPNETAVELIIDGRRIAADQREEIKIYKKILKKMLK